MGLDVSNPVCVESVKLLGDYWMIRIINALEAGEQRFGDVLRAVPGISSATLTDRLKKLEQARLVERKEVTRAEVSYKLTPLGHDALPLLSAINTFAQKVEAARQSEK